MTDIVDEQDHFCFVLGGKFFVADGDGSEATLRSLKYSHVTLIVDDADPDDPNDLAVDDDHHFIELFAETGEPNTFRILLGS